MLRQKEEKGDGKIFVLNDIMIFLHQSIKGGRSEAIANAKSHLQQEEEKLFRHPVPWIWQVEHPRY